MERNCRKHFPLLFVTFFSREWGDTLYYCVDGAAFISRRRALSLVEEEDNLSYRPLLAGEEKEERPHSSDEEKEREESLVSQRTGHSFSPPKSPVLFAKEENLRAGSLPLPRRRRRLREEGFWR